jgi:hypothetical protein
VYGLIEADPRLRSAVLADHGSAAAFAARHELQRRTRLG